jgi:hypothetical protein
MVGVLDVTIAGHKVKIEFLGDYILFQFADYSTARSIMNQPTPSLKPIGKLLSFSQIGLKARVGRRKPIELFPQPSWIVRWLSPSIREMIGAVSS